MLGITQPVGCSRESLNQRKLRRLSCRSILTSGTFKLIAYCLVTLSLSDEDFGKLVSGKANAQRLFMSGKLKVKGDVMKATKMEPILKKAQTKAKL